jgi:hypothetical protein
MGYQLVCETILEWLIYEEIPVQEDVQVFLQTAVYPFFTQFYK